MQGRPGSQPQLLPTLRIKTGVGEQLRQHAAAFDAHGRSPRRAAPLSPLGSGTSSCRRRHSSGEASLQPAGSSPQGQLGLQGSLERSHSLAASDVSAISAHLSVYAMRRQPTYKVMSTLYARMLPDALATSRNIVSLLQLQPALQFGERRAILHPVFELARPAAPPALLLPGPTAPVPRLLLCTLERTPARLRLLPRRGVPVLVRPPLPV